MKFGLRLASVLLLVGSPAVPLFLAGRAAPPAESSEKRPGPPAYTGAGSCASGPCHGSETPRTTFRVQQNEYVTWVLKDKHSKAYSALLGEAAKLMARNLRLAEPPEKAARCLDCHALNVPPERRGRTFVLSDGISCEACHGPAEHWLGPHTTRDWTHARSVEAGMNDTKNLLVRARTCLGCHLGDATRQVGHELIAAGHPDLVFELDAFCATMPAHWSETKEKGPWLGVRQWAVGQAVALAESMRLLGRRSSESSWPDFADYDCFGCHHGLVKSSYRISRGYPGEAGRPAWNRARFVVFGKLLEQVDPAAFSSVKTDLAALQRMLEEGRRDPAAVEAIAGRVAAVLDPVAKRLADPATPIDARLVEAVLRGIASEAHAIAAAGYRSAEQAALAVDALYRPYLGNVKATDAAGVKKKVDRLFGAVGDPNRFVPAEFAEALRAAGLEASKVASVGKP